MVKIQSMIDNYGYTIDEIKGIASNMGLIVSEETIVTDSAYQFLMLGLTNTIPMKIEQKQHPELSGEFSITNGVLSFTCHANNNDFDKVENGFRLLIAELNRQLENKHLCPFNKGN